MKNFIKIISRFNVVFTLLFLFLSADVYAHISVKYFGGAHRVSGSCSVLSANETSVITDCGMFYEETNMEADNTSLSSDIINANAMVLTHAHNDHAGRIPYIISKGFSGPVYMTTATKKIILETYNDGFGFDDIERDYFWSSYRVANIKKTKKGTAVLHWYSECRKNIKNDKNLADPKTSFTKRAVEKKCGVKFKLCKKCLDKYLKELEKQFVTVDYLEKTNISSDISFYFFDAGHIPGSASVLFYAVDGQDIKRIIMSGDLGSGYSDLVDDKGSAPEADFIFAESTYGGVSKGVSVSDYEQFRKDIAERLNENKIVWIPSLSLNRTQKVLYEIKKGQDGGYISGKVPVLSLSPSANSLTKLYEKEIKNPSMNRWFKSEIYDAGTILPANYKTKKQKEFSVPSVIISASGMMDRGVSVSLLKKLLPRKDVSVFLVSYAAPQTPAGKLKKGEKNIKTKYGTVKVAAEIKTYDIFSDHCDREGLVKWLSNQNKDNVKIYLVHGSPHNLNLSNDFLKSCGYKNVNIVMSKEILLN